MKYQQTSIIPIKQRFYNKRTNKIVNWGTDSKNSLDLKAISSFCSLGFMLDDDTFYNEIKVLHPSTKITLNNSNIVNREKTWEWNYNPTQRSFKNILEEFTYIFENIIVNKSKGKKILLPISGGLDSRTLFVPVKDKSNLTLSAYEFEGGLNETRYGKELAERFSLPFYAQKIPKGYLWHKIEKLIQLNNCFSEFTHPRQLAVLDNWKDLGDSILLGHMGDLLFESQSNTTNCPYNEQLILLSNKVIKPGGYELASDLWKYWGLNGTFDYYIKNRLDKLYGDINIDHPSARIRAFKSRYYVPRWSSINISIFQELGELILPYCEDEMCKFICTVPERYLKGRKIQIEYIKQNCPKAAQIPWDQSYPLNLFQYQWFNNPIYYPIRFIRKLKRMILEIIEKDRNIITRNWELQFLGSDNSLQLRNNLLNGNKIDDIIPQTMINDYINKFEQNPIKYAHPLSMLLTLITFINRYHNK